MTDQSKADQLPDNFLSLFNAPISNGVAATGVQPFLMNPGNVSHQIPQQIPQPQSAQIPTQTLPQQTPQPAQGQITLPVSPQFQPPVQPELQVQPALAPTPVQQIPVVASQPLTQVVPVPESHISAQALQAQLSAVQAENLQLKSVQAAQVQQVQDEQIASLPKQDQILAQLELMKRREDASIKRAQEWQCDSRSKDIYAEYSGEIERSVLNTSSLDALEASVPMAREAFARRENESWQRFKAQMGHQQQVAVEGLPPSPISHGLPSSNAAGAVVSLPATVVPQGNAQQLHPQMSRDNAYNYTQAGAGRVFQPQGMAPPPSNTRPLDALGSPQGQYHVAPTYYAQPQPGQYPAQVSQPQVMHAPLVPNVTAYQMAQQALAPSPAPLPDPRMRADGNSGGRALMPNEANSAVEAARLSVQRGRNAGVSGARTLGMGESISNQIALGGGGHHPITPASLPIPTGADRDMMHPQYLAGARV